MVLKNIYPKFASKIIKQKDIKRIEIPSFLSRAFENRTKSRANNGGKKGYILLRLS